MTDRHRLCQKYQRESASSVFIRVLNKALAIGLIALLIAWSLPLQATSHAAPLAQSGEIYHTVQPGENLFRISLRYGVSIQAVMQANGITDASRVYVGQRLRIPSNTPLPAPAPAAPETPAAPAGDTTHVVQPGENLFRIGLRYGVTAQALALANGLPNVSMVYVGQRLTIPTTGNTANVAVSNTGTAPVLAVPVDNQDRLLSCEASAAGMIAAFYRPTPPQGYFSWEKYFIGVIPPHYNPHRGFRGNMDGQQSTAPCVDHFCSVGYGVYAEPVAQALQEAGLGIGARAEYGVDYAAVAQAIQAGHPVIVWIFHPDYYKSYNPATMLQVETDPETNQTYKLIEGEHVLVVRGVSADGKSFLVNDPYQGRSYWVSTFNHWDLLDGMRVIVE
jgi:LysM repeat protein